MPGCEERERGRKSPADVIHATIMRWSITDSVGVAGTIELSRTTFPTGELFSHVAVEGFSWDFRGLPPGLSEINRKFELACQVRILRIHPAQFEDPYGNDRILRLHLTGFHMTGFSEMLTGCLDAPHCSAGDSPVRNDITHVEGPAKNKRSRWTRQPYPFP